jgi:hypothetical protein
MKGMTHTQTRMQKCARSMRLMAFGCAASFALVATAGCLAEDVESEDSAVADESLEELESESDPEALASCLYQPANPNWYCQAECNDYWAGVTFRNKADGTKAAGTRLYFSGGASGYNSTRHMSETYHGVLDHTANKVLWPTAPPPDFVLIAEGNDRSDDTSRPAEGHIVEVLAGPFADPAIARCRVR